MKLYLKICLSLLFLYVSMHVLAHETILEEDIDAVLKVDRDNIKVYLYPHQNSHVNAFRAEMYIHAPLDSILAVMFDNASCEEWVHNCGGSVVLKRVSFTEQYHYQVARIPFPFKNREFIFRSVMQQDPTTKSLTIKMSAIDSFCKADTRKKCYSANILDAHQVTDSFGVYRLEPDGVGTKIIWHQHTEPGRDLPAWLVNYFLEETPYHTLKNLAAMVHQEKYKFAKLIYDTNGIAKDIDVITETTESVNQFTSYHSF